MLRLEGEAPDRARGGAAAGVPDERVAGRAVLAGIGASDAGAPRSDERTGGVRGRSGGAAAGGTAERADRAGPWPWDEIVRLSDGRERAPRGGAAEGASHGGSALMSQDPDPKRPGKVTRLHPPRLPHQASLDRAVQAQIGAQLRTMYEHYVDQPIPDRLIDLVQRLGEVRGADGGHPDVGGARGEARPGDRGPQDEERPPARRGSTGEETR